MARWNLFDPTTDESYDFAVNPNSGGSLTYDKKITYQNTLGPGGNTIIFEGADEPYTLEFSGVLLSQAQHETFVDWWSKRRQVELTDDLGRTYTVYITSYQPKRNRRVLHPYHHDYTIKCTVLDFTG